MEEWYKKAIEAFPDLIDHFAMDGDTTYGVFSALCYTMENDWLPSNNRQEIQKAFDYAHWAADQEEDDLWNAAGVGFFEHVFEKMDYFGIVVSYLTKDDVRAYMDLWEMFCEKGRFEELQDKLKQRGLYRP
jgi:hypothetical protein